MILKEVGRKLMVTYDSVLHHQSNDINPQPHILYENC